jgi:uncharacterized membrane protein YhaH (DUF805 family)
MRTFIFCLKDGYSKALDFRGRTRRRDHWIFLLGLYLSFIPIAIASSLFARLALLYVPGLIGTFLDWIFQLLPLLIIGVSYFASALRRIHDAGKSGWFYLIPIYNFYLLVKKGQTETNEWGEPT